MTGQGLRLALRGLWFRRSTALIVLGLTTVASAAAVVAPVYSRAAEESILRDTLQRTDTFTLSVHVSVPEAASGTRPERADDAAYVTRAVDRELSHPAFARPRLAFDANGLYEPTRGRIAGGEVTGRVVERAGVCDQVPIVAGRCPSAPGEGMTTERSLELVGARLGETVEVELTDAANIGTGEGIPTVPIRLVGTYEPVPVESPYWVGRPYFDGFNPEYDTKLLNATPPNADPVFVGDGTSAAEGITSYTIDVPVRRSLVGLEDGATLRAELGALRNRATSLFLTTVSQLPDAIERSDEGRDLVRIAAPLAVVQLVLLSWWTLYLVVSSATEERSPELGLAKLRGLSARQTRRFGLAEVVLLLLVAAPLGTVLGWAAVRAGADRVFAPGTEVRLTWPVALTVVGTLLGGIATAALASRHVFTRPVAELLRRVPSRRTRGRAHLVDVTVLVLTAAAVLQLVNDRGERPSPVAMLAPGLIAVAGGLLAARMLVRVARRRVRSATERGQAQRLAGWAAVARRPGTARIASVLAVATCLLLVGVQAWTVAERNRSERAAAETGAAVVLDVRAPDSRALLEAVRAADPGGAYALAAVEVAGSTQAPTLLAIDSRRADAVLTWGRESERPQQPVRAAVHPDLPQPIVVRPGRLAAEVDLQAVDSPSPLQLTARLDAAGTPVRIDLGALRSGVHTYTGTVPKACAGGCRLAALAVDHPGTDIRSATATFEVRSLSRPDDAVQEIAADFRRPGAWRPGTPTTGGPQVRLRPGAALVAEVTAPGGPYAEIVRGDSPEPLPALVSRGAADPRSAAGGIPVGETTGISGRPTRYRVASVARYVPGVDRAAVVVDLELALRLTEQAAEGSRQVWLARDDAAAERRLVAALRDSGIGVTGRSSAADLERVYAGDGAVLALRLLLLCGAAAVVVAVGALLVAAYVGRRQRAYEVAALRAVGLRRRTLRGLLVRENLGTVLVALTCGSVAAALATWVTLPALPEFDTPSSNLAVRHAPHAVAAWAAVGGLAAVLVVVGLVVAHLQLSTGRPDRLREGR